MADAKPQPMVTVKKPDGTFVKVPLSQLKKRDSSAPPATPVGMIKTDKPRPAAPAPKTEPVKAQAPKAEPPRQPAPKQQPTGPQPKQAATPQQQPKQEPPKPQIQIKPAPKPRAWTREDAKSPLEEKAPVKSPAMSAVSSNRESQVEAVLKRLGFSVAPDIQNRLRSVIQLRLKDLRTEEETRETARRASREGGLDLSEAQAEKLVKTCADVLTAGAASAKPGLPVVEKEELPATTTPFNAFVHKQPAAAPAPAETKAAPVPQRKAALEKVFSLGGQPAARQTMQDIAPPAAEMGPVEELKYLTLVDFRRLSAKPEEAASRLRQKFYNLQEESILLYMDALAAYHHSPLYTDYVKLVCASLANRKPLESLTQDKNRLQMAEIKALVEMEKGL